MIAPLLPLRITGWLWYQVLCCYVCCYV